VWETRDPLSLPLLVRPNSVIPVGNRTDRPDYDYSEGVSLQIYQLEDGHEVHVEIPALDGTVETNFHLKRDGDTIHIQRQGVSKTWNVLLIGIDSLKNVEHAQIEITNGSTAIKAQAGVHELKIQLT
jgi:alpha-D-xyloside xylohydrolase